MSKKSHKIKELLISEIIVDAKPRRELGDLESLKQSISDQGMFHAILVDENYVLAAGERRYTACKELGYETISAKIIKGLSKEDKLMIEWLENKERKDFLWYEELELRYRLHLMWSSDPNLNPWGYRETAEKLRCSIGGLSTDLTLAKMMASLPHLKQYDTKTKARDACKKLIDDIKADEAIQKLPEEAKQKLQDLRDGNLPAITKAKEEVKELKAKEKKKNPLPNAKNPDGSPDLKDLIDVHVVNSEKAFDTNTDVRVKKKPEIIYAIEPIETFLPKVPDDSVGFVEIDPPYAIDFNNTYCQLSNTEVNATDWTVETLMKFYKTQLPIIYNKMMDNSWCLCWTGKEHWKETNEIALEVGFKIQYPGIWNKVGGSCNTPKTTMISNYETFLLFRKGIPIFNVPSVPAVWNYSSVPASKRIHQWEKPMEMYRYMMDIMGRPGAFFLSPFAGSGNSMIAAAVNGMLPLGCDTSEKYLTQFYLRLDNYFLE